MLIFKIIAVLLMTAGIVLLFGLTPERITDDILRFLYKEQSLMYKVKIAQGKKKKSKIRTALLDIYNALRATHSENKFTLFCVIALADIIAGCLVSAMLNNYLFLPVFVIIGVMIPYGYVHAIVGSYNKKVSEELETALSIITTSYISNEDIIHAAESSIEYIHPPVQQTFKEFLGKTKLISSNVKLAILQMRGSINNEIFHEWCDNLLECQDNITLKLTLQPITMRLADVRIVNAELETMLQRPRSEFFMMLALVVGNIPLLRLINNEWFLILFTTTPGQIALGITALTCIITGARCYKLTQPIDFKR